MYKVAAVSELFLIADIPATSNLEDPVCKSLDVPNLNLLTLLVPSGST